MTQPRDTADVIGSRGTAATVDTGLLTGNVPTADDLSMVGQTVNYTGGNYQPEIRGGLNTSIELFQESGSAILVGGTVVGNLVKTIERDSGGTITGAAILNGSHVYKNIGTDCANNRSTTFVRIS